jgi:hypothetical protein
MNTHIIEAICTKIQNTANESIKLLRNKDVVYWLFADTTFITKDQDKKNYKQLEDKWGQDVFREQRPDLKLDKQWTNRFGEYICNEIFTLLGNTPKKPEKKEHFQPDSEIEYAIIEAKTQTYFTSGTAGEKILGSVFKYADIPELYSKPLKIICIGGAEKICRQQYGNLDGSRCTERKQKLLTFYKNEMNIEFVAATDLLLGWISEKVEETPTDIAPTENYVPKLKEHLLVCKSRHDQIIMQQKSLKDAHIYCVVNNVSAQQFGPLLEMYIREKYNYVKNNAKHCTGDCTKNGENTEIKVSLGGAMHTKFNYVQIRPSHDCDTYILTAYHVSPDNVETEGELYIFKIPKSDMITLIISYGGYAHGTIKEHGNISTESFLDKNSKKEYALRPVFNDECWKALLQYRVHEI